MKTIRSLTLLLVVSTVACDPGGGGGGAEPARIDAGAADMAAVDMAAADSGAAPDMTVAADMGPDPDMMAQPMVDMGPDPDMRTAQPAADMGPDPDMRAAQPLADMGPDPDMMVDVDMAVAPEVMAEYVVLNLTDTIYDVRMRLVGEPASEVAFAGLVAPGIYNQDTYAAVDGAHEFVLYAEDGTDLGSFESPFARPQPQQRTYVVVHDQGDGVQVDEFLRTPDLPYEADWAYFIVYNLTRTNIRLDNRVNEPSLDRPLQAGQTMQVFGAIVYEPGVDLTGTGSFDTRLSRQMVLAERDEFFLHGNREDGYAVSYKAAPGALMARVALPVNYPENYETDVRLRNFSQAPLTLWWGWPNQPLTQVGALVPPRTRIDALQPIPSVDFPLFVIPEGLAGERANIVATLPMLRAQRDRTKSIRIFEAPDGTLSAHDNDTAIPHHRGADRDWAFYFNIGQAQVSVSHALIGASAGEWAASSSIRPGLHPRSGTLMAADTVTIAIDVDEDGTRDWVKTVPQQSENEFFFDVDANGGTIYWTAAPGAPLSSAPMDPAP